MAGSPNEESHGEEGRRRRGDDELIGSEEEDGGGLAQAAERRGLTMKEIVCEQFEALRALYKTQATQRGAKGREYHYMQLCSLAEALPDFFSFGDLMREAGGVHGVGEATKRKLEEIWRRGALLRVEEALLNPANQAKRELCSVHGIGVARAHELISQHGVRSLEALRQRPDLLSEASHIYLDLYDELQQPVPRDEIAKIERAIADVAVALDRRIRVQACGSYRRGEASSKDADILVWLSDDERNEGLINLLDRLERRLREAGLITHDLNPGRSLPSRTFTGIFRLGAGHPHRRLDLKVCTEREYPTALMQFSSGMVFQRFLQRRARELSPPLKLSMLGLCYLDEAGEQRGGYLRLASEEDIFVELRCVYMPPELRRTKLDVIDADTGRPVFERGAERRGALHQRIGHGGEPSSGALGAPRNANALGNMACTHALSV